MSQGRHSGLRPGLLLSRLALVLACVFLLLPILIVIPLSFGDQRYLAFPQNGPSLRHYQALTVDPWLGSILQSLSIAATVALVSTLLAAMFVTGIWLRRRFGTLLTGVVLLPIIVPQVVSAMSFYYLGAQLGLLDSFAGVAFGHLLMVLPYSVITLLVAYNRIDPAMFRAARSLGASVGRAVYDILLPNLRLGLASSFFMAFLMSWDEVVVTLFISGLDVITLPKRIWDGLRYSLDPAIASVSTTMVALTLIVMVARLILAERTERARRLDPDD
ncbi:ABC transporter permease [Nitratireductor alexandrii]|uniref:ABC transporter permease n=1 Tax=Nitratireductor alexandrii TaxID=2448161 RepID=UPI000FDAC7FC|nr:ABC transporter permease [Nitratireductor alexandrii]